MLKVLLVDDEPFILQGLSMLIDWEQAGYEIIGMASNAQEAMEIIRLQQPELVITDIKMPQMNGLELIESVRTEINSEIFFVVLSGYSDFEYARKALQNDCVDYMLKPINQVELMRVLEKVKEKFVANELELEGELQNLDEKTRRIIHSFVSFELQNEEEKWKHCEKLLNKNKIDALVRAVDIHQVNDIDTCVKNIYEDLQNMDGPGFYMAMNYLMFQLIHLASQEDDTINQQEVVRFISYHAFYEMNESNGCEKLIQLMEEYADYLVQLRGNQGIGTLNQVECYLRENYKENITLKDLGKKYYMNAAYLGQLFKKQYGESFKDYLNRIRIEKAQELLLQTDLKIYEIAEEIGYKDIDYFINKFIAVNNCTPTKYRKQKTTKVS